MVLGQHRNQCTIKITFRQQGKHTNASNLIEFLCIPTSMDSKSVLFIGHMEDKVTQAGPESRVFKNGFTWKIQATTSYFDTCNIPCVKVLRFT